MHDRKPVAILAITQLVSWACCTTRSACWRAGYSPTSRSPPARHLARSPSVLVAGLAATPVGIAIDRHGGRGIMVLGSILASVGLCTMATAASFGGYLLAWTILGAAMSLTLYEAAFATLNKSHHRRRREVDFDRGPGRRLSTKHRLLAVYRSLGRATGLARNAHGLRRCAIGFVRAAALGAGWCNRHSAAGQQHGGVTLPQAMRQLQFWLLAAAFAFNAFIFSVLSVPDSCRARVGARHGLGVITAGRVDRAMVAGRLAERTLGARRPPALIGAYTFAALPVALLVFALWSPRLRGRIVLHPVRTK